MSYTGKIVRKLDKRQKEHVLYVLMDPVDDTFTLMKTFVSPVVILLSPAPRLYRALSPPSWSHGRCADRPHVLDVWTSQLLLMRQV